jgi:hypothetical protein
MWAGGGMLAVGAIYFLFSAIFALQQPEEPAVTPSVVVQRSVPPVSETRERLDETQAVAPSDLPVADEEASVVVEPEPAEPRVKKKAVAQTRSGSSGTGSGSKGTPVSGGGKKSKGSGCNQPWYVDKQGIRRIKAECL